MSKRGFRDDAIYFDHSGDCRDARLHKSCSGRWRGAVSLGTARTASASRRKVSGQTKQDVEDKLGKLHSDLEAGVRAPVARYTVGQAVEDWLREGLDGRSEKTVTLYRQVLQSVVDRIGKVALRDLTAQDARRVLAEAAGTRSSRTVGMVHNSLERAIRHAEANDYVRRNVAALVDSPTGQTGRPSRSLTIEQGASLLAPAEASPLGAYVVLCLLTGVRTEEARALTWDHVDLDGSAARGRQALAMAFKLIEAAQDRWRAVNAPHLVALVSAPERPSSTANSSNDPAGTPGRKPPEDRIPQAVTIAPLILSMRTSGRGSVEVIDAGRAVGAGQPGTSEGDAGHLSYSLAVTSGCLLPRCLLDSV